MSDEKKKLPYRQCGAKKRLKNELCRGAAMANGRCRLHGGKSTGAKTPEGKKRSRRGNWKTGFHSAEAKAERQEIAQLLRDTKQFLRSMKGN